MLRHTGQPVLEYLGSGARARQPASAGFRRGHCVPSPPSPAMAVPSPVIAR
jgi:hypothetical protein